MNYDKACNQLYNDRLAEKAKCEANRQKFRQSVLDRQNNRAHVPIGNEYKSEVDIVGFIMPDNLLNDEAYLKKLIYENYQLMQNHPSRLQEAKNNIKRIKDFINEQKK